MGIYYRKRIRLLPGIYLNLSKSGWSVSIQLGPFHYNFGPGGKSVGANLPGGLSYRKRLSRNKK
ncbi:MAG: DUF4236 domain-containing protein [Aeromonas sp.]